MFEQIYNSYTLITQSVDSTFITWFGMIINIFVAIGTIIAAIAAWNGAKQARKAADNALQIHRESEEKRDKNKEVDTVLKSLKFLKCILQEVHINLEDIKTIHKTIKSLKDKKSEDLYGEVGGFRSINNVGKNIFYMSNNDILMNIENPDVISNIINTYNDISYSKDIISNVESENNSLKNMFKEYLDAIKEDIKDLEKRNIENNKLRKEYNLEIISLYDMLLKNLDINIISLSNCIYVIKDEITRLMVILNDVDPNLKGIYIDKTFSTKRKTYK